MRLMDLLRNEETPRQEAALGAMAALTADNRGLQRQLASYGGASWTSSSVAGYGLTCGSWHARRRTPQHTRATIVAMAGEPDTSNINKLLTCYPHMQVSCVRG